MNKSLNIITEMILNLKRLDDYDRFTDWIRPLQVDFPSYFYLIPNLSANHREVPPSLRHLVQIKNSKMSTNFKISKFFKISKLKKYKFIKLNFF